ncbi:MAG TPA: Sua5/YciO/YrdC/YwlC family protein, partial [Anaerolineales bacterium]|nr:Sua5/YciO/YrdC/YwlC family protein [Anaerolineales bacterium]
MKTDILSANSPNTIVKALGILNSGGLVAFPTDTVYGVGALAFDGNAVESIYVAKDRPAEKAITILIGDLDDMDNVGINIHRDAYKLASRYWPGP